MLKASKRLELIASLVPIGARVCDIGTDHGYLSIELIKSGKAKRVIATDVNEKPLAKAEENIKRANVGGIELRLCDGLEDITEAEVDTIVIAGMGGEVISEIINNGERVAKSKEKLLILQPTTSPEALRCFLYRNGYEITKEIPISESGKVYSVMLCRYCGNLFEYADYMCYIGEITAVTDDGYMYIKKQYDRCFSCSKALESISKKQDEYNYYRNVALALAEKLKM